MTHKKLLIGAVVLVILMVSLMSQSLLFPPKKVETVVFLSNYGTRSHDAPFYVALERGYFKAEGISPTFLEGKGSGFGMTHLDSGNADIAMVDMTSLIQYVELGSKVKAVMVVYKMPMGIVTLEERGIKTLEDLEGCSIGDVAGSSIPTLLSAAMRLHGADPSNITYSNVESSLKKIGLIKGVFDASTTSYPTLYEWERLANEYGKQVNFLLLVDYLDVYGYVVAANADFLRQKPDLVRGFLRAYVKGLQDTVKDPETAAATLVKYYPQFNSTILNLELPPLIEMMGKDAVLRGDVGFDLDRVKVNLEVAATGLGTPIGKPPSEFYTNEYLTR